VASNHPSEGVCIRELGVGIQEQIGRPCGSASTFMQGMHLAHPPVGRPGAAVGMEAIIVD
jgi:hypothetical protein